MLDQHEDIQMYMKLSLCLCVLILTAVLHYYASYRSFKLSIA